jgi:K+-sensing histidine kinase KdpD
MEQVVALSESYRSSWRLSCTPPQLDAFARWVVALALLLAALSLRLELEMLPRTDLFALFYPAVLLSAWLCGTAPAGVVAVGSVASVWWFLVRVPGTLSAPPAGAAVSILLFLAGSAFGIGLIACLAWAVAQAERRDDR